MRVNKSFVIFLVLVFITAACNLNIPGQPTERPTDIVYTEAAQTVVAQLTEAAPEVTDTSPPPPPTDTLEPTSTRTPLPTDTPQPTATRTPTPTVTNTPLGADTATPTETLRPTGIPGLVFQDNFKEDRDWFTGSGDNYVIEYTNNAYRIYNNILGGNIYSVREREFENTHLEVDATQIEGPEDGFYGLICRFVDGNNYYALVVSSDETYGIGMMKEGKFEFLETGEMEEDFIDPEDEYIRIGVDCIDSKLSVFANGGLLLEIEDENFDSGAVGLLVGNRVIEEGTDVIFDNFFIYNPDLDS
jgi:hypothetical protein